MSGHDERCWGVDGWCRGCLGVCSQGSSSTRVLGDREMLISIQNAESKSRTWAFILLGALSAALLCAGVLRHYWDIYIHRTVRGISFIFVGIDALGDVFSLASVCESSWFPIPCIPFRASGESKG